MKNLMKTNVYDVKESMVIVGSCLKEMQPRVFDELNKTGIDIFEVCLEEQHINMVITKLASMIARVEIKKIIFASVDKSPHCIQLHYIENELKKIMNIENVKFEHYVAVDGELIKVSNETIKLSKSLNDLQKLVDKK